MKLANFPKFLSLINVKRFTNFQNSTIWNINKFFKFYHLENQFFTISKNIKYFGCSNNY